MEFIKNWKKTRTTANINRLSFLLVHEAFTSRKDIKKDNMTLLIIDVGYVFRMFNKVTLDAISEHRKSSEGISTKNLSRLTSFDFKEVEEPIDEAKISSESG
jgi:hypothetical protein